MKKAELSVIRYTAEDVIATSGGGLCTVPSGNWSQKSYRAIDVYTVIKGQSSISTNYGTPVDGSNYNFLDGEGSYFASGQLLTEGSYYHYNVSSYAGEDGFTGLPMYSEWWTCNDSSHHLQ